MTNIFMEEFKKRLTKGLLIGAAIILIMLLSPLLTNRNPFASIPWYLVPVVLIITVLYGTGWCFAYNIILRAWRKFLRVNEEASIIQMLVGRGLIFGFFSALLFLTIGCFISFVVGNIFMLCDFIMAKQGKAPISVKYKFDGDKNYDKHARYSDIIKSAVHLNEAENNVSEEVRIENERNLRKIDDGQLGTVTTIINGKENKTTID